MERVRVDRELELAIAQIDIVSGAEQRLESEVELNVSCLILEQNACVLMSTKSAAS